MSTSKLTANDRARQFIDDVLKINAEYGMRSVESEGAYEAAVADAARSARSYEQISGHIGPAAQRSR
jgi:hypothetical protein